MDEIVAYVLKEAGNQYVALALIAVFLMWRTGLIQFLTGVRASERFQLSADQHRLVEDLRMQVAGLDSRMVAERIEYNRRIVELRAECEADVAKLHDEISKLINGESRWRHLTGNLASYVAALQNELRKVSIEVPRFGGWDKFIEEGGDPRIAFPLDGV